MDKKDSQDTSEDSLYASFLVEPNAQPKQEEGFFNLSAGKQKKLKAKVKHGSVGENKYTKMKLAKPTDSGFRRFRKVVGNFFYRYTSPFRKLFSFVGSGAVGKQVIMLVPESTGKTVALPITNIFLVVLFITIAVIASFGTISYKKFADERLLLSNINRDNRNITTEIRKYSLAVGELKEKMSTYRSFLSELANFVSFDNHPLVDISDLSSGGGYSETIDSIKRNTDEISKLLYSINSFYDSREYYRAMIPVGWPVAGGGRITSGYGERSNPFTMRTSFHSGIDIADEEGTPIIAVADGTVTFSGWRNAYGNFVIIQHKNGYQTGYAHNSRNIVEAGDRVRKGQIIAEMGKTGRVTGVHSHFEVRINNDIVQPVEYVSTRF